MERIESLRLRSAVGGPDRAHQRQRHTHPHVEPLTASPSGAEQEALRCRLQVLREASASNKSEPGNSRLEGMPINRASHSTGMPSAVAKSLICTDSRKDGSDQLREEVEIAGRRRGTACRRPLLPRCARSRWPCRSRRSACRVRNRHRVRGRRASGRRRPAERHLHQRDAATIAAPRRRARRSPGPEAAALPEVTPRHFPAPTPPHRTGRQETARPSRRVFRRRHLPTK